MQNTSHESSVVVLRCCALRQRWLQWREFLGLEVAAGLPLSKLPVRPPIIHTERGCTYDSYCCSSKAQREIIGFIKFLSMVQFHLNSTQFVLPTQAEGWACVHPWANDHRNTQHLEDASCMDLKHLYTKLHPSNLSTIKPSFNLWRRQITMLSLLSFILQATKQWQQTCWKNCSAPCE